MHTRYSLPIHFQCQNAWKCLSSKCEKSIKIYPKIISKPHAHLQSMIKTTVKFQKNRNIAVGEVAHIK